MPLLVLYFNSVNVQLITCVFIVQLFWPQGATHTENRRLMRSLMPDGSLILTSQTLMHGSWEKVNLLMTECILANSFFHVLSHRSCFWLIWNVRVKILQPNSPQLFILSPQRVVNKAVLTLEPAGGSWWHSLTKHHSIVYLNWTTVLSQWK